MSSEKINYLVFQDLKTTHVRRVKVMVLAVGFFLLFLGLAYAAFFLARADWLIASAELALSAVGIYSLWLLRANKLRFATLVLVFTLFMLFALMALFMDVPSPAVPRSVHHGFIPLALASYLMLTDERALIRHGLPLACLSAAAWFSSTNFGFVSPYVVPEDVRVHGIWVNNLAAYGILYLLVHIFIGDINRMESFFHNANNRFVTMVGRMFPEAIAERLLSTGETFAERHAACSILFADIVGFTAISERLTPDALVSMLADIFSRFDQCVERFGLTKIKTMGDAYMVAAGLPKQDPQHATQLLKFASEILILVEPFDGVRLRIGIASGEVVAGVIGQSRQVFDVWGDVVNTASRMESQGLPGRIQVSESTYQLTQHQFNFEKRADLTLKGKPGKHDAYLLGEKAL